MAEYIEREAARETVCDMCRWEGTSNCDECEHPIDDIPAADVREVVFCRDCLHYEWGACLKIYDDGAANKDAWQERRPEDFCSYGEKRGADMRGESDD